MMIHEHKDEDNSVRLDTLRAKMDAACNLLGESYQTLNTRCNEFEALLDAPDRSQAAIRQSNDLVRAAGLRSMGLTTEYLMTLHAYMQKLSSQEKASNEEANEG